ncbi:unnamed protein product [Parajaminaea phylloscopi]
MDPQAPSRPPPLGAAFQIIPGVQKYDWGIKGKDGSLVAVYGAATEQLNLQIQDDEPYAELWMGTHPTLPSRIVTQNASGTCPTLSEYLNQNPSLLGDKVVAKYGTGITRNGGVSDAQGNPKDQGALPFLFKILSAGKALSIQAHPDKELAKRLHKQKPQSYRDDNHKPEMAIALTDFKGFCGFRPLPEIVHFLNVVPEFRALVQPSDELLAELRGACKPSDAAPASASATDEQTRSYLRQIFSALMKAPSDLVRANTSKISQRYGDGGSQVEVSDDLAELVCTLDEQFPQDIGIFCTFVLNVVTMQPGQAMFLKANEPHAYISGNIVECMAASDNVVRAGLTPKERDVDVLVDMLTYTSGGADKQLMKPKSIFQSQGQSPSQRQEPSSSSSSVGEDLDATPSLVYDPPIDEFSVALTRLRGGQSQSQHGLDGPSILIHTAGKGTAVARGASAEGTDVTFHLDKPGKVFFVGAGTTVDMSADGSDEGGAAAAAAEPLTAYRAFVEA